MAHYVNLTGLNPEAAVRGRGHRKTTEQRLYDRLCEYTEKLKKYDYTSYDDDVPYYTMFVKEDGNKIKLLLDLTDEMLHTIKTLHPQKVYFA